MTPARGGTAQDRVTVIQGKPGKGLCRDSVLALGHAMEHIFESFIIWKSALTGQSC